MRRTAALPFLIFALGLGTVSAQTENTRHAQFYLCYAPAATTVDGSRAKQGGFGMDYIVHKGLGFGAEVGGISSSKTFAEFSLMSLNGSYHFIPRNIYRRWDPFVTGGYTVAVQEGSASMINFGGGTNYWLRRHVALRVEVRGYVAPGLVRSGFPEGKNDRFWGLRLGLAF